MKVLTCSSQLGIGEENVTCIAFQTPVLTVSDENTVGEARVLQTGWNGSLGTSPRNVRHAISAISKFGGKNGCLSRSPNHQKLSTSS